MVRNRHYARTLDIFGKGIKTIGQCPMLSIHNPYNRHRLRKRRPTRFNAERILILPPSIESYIFLVDTAKYFRLRQT
jgi:hypothetical protein